MNTQIWFLGLASILSGVVVKSYMDNIQTPGVLLRIIDLWEDKMTHVAIVITAFIFIFLFIAQITKLAFGDIKEMERIVGSNDQRP